MVDCFLCLLGFGFDVVELVCVDVDGVIDVDDFECVFVMVVLGLIIVCL